MGKTQTSRLPRFLSFQVFLAPYFFHRGHQRLLLENVDLMILEKLLARQSLCVNQMSPLESVVMLIGWDPEVGMLTRLHPSFSGSK